MVKALRPTRSAPLKHPPRRAPGQLLVAEGLPPRRAIPRSLVAAFSEWPAIMRGAPHAGLRANERTPHSPDFVISVLLKGVHALIECLGGIALYLVSTDTIVRLVNRATQDEIREDPNDFVA